MYKKILTVIITMLLMVVMTAPMVLAANVSLLLNCSIASPGDDITASGTADANSWVAIKVVDSMQSIVVFDAVKSNADGTYSYSFQVPADTAGNLTVVAGYDTNVAIQQLSCGNMGVSHTLNREPRHSSCTNKAAYSKAEYLYDTFTITGSGMKQGEKIYSVKEIENLYMDSNFGCDVTYSITGSEGRYSAYTLSGVPLYEMLVQAGIDMSLPDSTQVTFMAKDGYNSIRTLGDIRNIEQYNYYNEAGVVQTGTLPVLLAFASNGYPLVGPIGFQGWFDNGIAGLVEENANGGGPLKVTFGQTAPGDNNAQYNSKLLYKIIVGNDDKNSQHNRVPYSQYGNDQLTIQLINAATAKLTSSQTYTVNEIEAMVNANNTALVRNYYPDSAANYYEGIDLWYLLAEKFGLIGNEGEFSFVDASGTESQPVNLEYLRNAGKDYSGYYTAKEGLPISWVKPVLVYGKNGEPLQDQGPLLAALPQHTTYLSQGLVQACTGINVYIQPDDCTHSTEPYLQLKDDQITFTGDGLNTSRDFTVEQLEQMLELIQEDSYTVGSETANYRGINLYSLLTSNKLGLKMTTDRIEVSAQDGSLVSFRLDELQSSERKVMLAYGKNNQPLVISEQDAGYVANAANSGGPIYLVVNGDAGRCLAQVMQVKVIAQATESWKHDRQAPYDAYLDTTWLRICGSAMASPKVYSLRELEAMNEGIVREYLAASEVMGYYEGLNLKYLLQTAGITGLPTKITVCSPDVSGTVFAKELAVNDVWSGITSSTQNGVIKPVVLAYAKDGYPLANSLEPEAGYVAIADNGFGPLRLVVENSKPLCVKYVAGVIVGEGTPVAYTVNYLDQDSGQAIVNAKISIGTDGESMSALAEKISISGYAFSRSEQENIDLNATNKASNVINLYYEKDTSVAKVSLILSSNTASSGESVTASGTADASTWVSIKVVDSNQNILVFDAIKSSADGKYSYTFKVPADISDTLTVVAGYDTNVARQDLICTTETGGGDVITATAQDDSVTMASGNLTVSSEDNTWKLTISGGELKATLDASDIEFTGIPNWITVSAAKETGTNNIIITLAGTAESKLSQSLTISAKVLSAAFTGANVADTNTVNLKLLQKADCFIATAAFGSYLDAHVKVLRNFRDTVLLNYAPGRWFIREYYQHSPQLAAIIRVNPTLKWTTRALLTPIIFGIEYPLQFLGGLIGLLGVCVLLRRRRIHTATI